ncbi:MAG: IPExxxVDY family protein [Cyclobacteriaceae bacterium]
MKKNKLDAEYPIDFELIGIVSQAREYKLGWHLNQLPNIHLVKGEDIKIDFADNHIIRASNLEMVDEYQSVCLLQNKLVSSTSALNKYLISELQQFDYLMKLSNQIHSDWAQYLIQWVRTLPVVEYSLIIDVAKVKSKENLFF